MRAYLSEILIFEARCIAAAAPIGNSETDYQVHTKPFAQDCVIFEGRWTISSRLCRNNVAASASGAESVV